MDVKYILRYRYEMGIGVDREGKKQYNCTLKILKEMWRARERWAPVTEMILV